MDNLEKLAVLTALQKAVKQQIDIVREQANAELMDAYVQDGVEKKALRVNGEKVGNFLIAFDKAKYVVTDPVAFEDFALSNGLADIKESIIPAYMAQAVQIVKREMPEAISERVELSPDWDKCFDHVGDLTIMEGTDHVVPGVTWQAAQPKCTQVRECKPEVVIPLVNSLSGAEPLLLGEGE